MAVIDMIDDQTTAISGGAHGLPADDVLLHFEVDAQQGLDSQELAQRRAQHGYNELTEVPPVPRWKKFLRQFRELVIIVLLVAAVVAGAVGDWTDTVAILAIVLLNAVISFLQEERAERSLAALRRLSAPTAKVLRSGVLKTVPARELIPGDVVELAAGDHVPADLRLLSSFGLRVQESALTGESEPVDKNHTAVMPPATALGDRRNMAYLGTVTTAGKAHGLVVTTGMETELGHIAGLLQRQTPEPTPLQRRLAELGRVLIVIILVIIAIVFTVQLMRGGQLLDVFLFSISLAVAAIPEGLPAVVTIALALGLQRMVKRHALVRKLPSVETLGSVTVICSDKTGTLTRNEMTVREMFVGDRLYRISGVGYAPSGSFSIAADGHGGGTDELVQDVDPASDGDLIQTLTIAARCNDAKLLPRESDDEMWQVIGDPTEGALLVAALKAGVEGKGGRHHVLYEIPFDSERKAMSVVVREPDAGVLMYTKGAPEVILSTCVAERYQGSVRPLTDARREQIMRANAAMADRALRTLALAYRDQLEAGHEFYEETQLVFAGLAGMIDPPREEVKAAITKCRDAGIRPVMITGDHPATAMAVARELGLAAADSRVATGAELDAMPDDELVRQADQLVVYARVSAAHKLRVVQAWKSRGDIVAMTGDGVNDAPAVKAADIGIAMGVTGTDVTKEASAMVLTDDNFASIVNAVEEGRGIYDNIQKSLQYLLAGSIGEVLFVFAAAVIGWPFPLVAIQILWINLVTNGLPALGLAMEPPERDLMQRPPRPPKEPVITTTAGLRMLYHGALFAAVAAFGFWFIYQGEADNLPRARTVAFCVIALAEVLYAIGCRSHRYTMPEIGPLANPHLFGAIVLSALLQFSAVTLPLARTVFETVPLQAHNWVLVLVLALAPVTLIEVAKLVRKAVKRDG